MYRSTLFVISIYVAFGLHSSAVSLSIGLEVYEAKMPSACGEKSFCTDKGNYPHELVDEILENTKTLFKDVDLPPRHRIENNVHNECRVSHNVNPIYWIVDTKDTVRYVVQSESRFMQILDIEECLHPGLIVNRTLHFSEKDVADNKMYCNQSYVDFNFLVLTTDLKGVETARAKGGIPICCKCEYGGK